MQKTGTIVRWDATRAFGFIRSPQTTTEVFFHVRDFRGSAPPSEGLAVRYEEIHVGGKGPRAMAVQPVTHGDGSGSQASSGNAPLPRRTPERRSGRAAPRTRPAGGRAAFPALALLLTTGWIALLGWGVWTRQLPLAGTLAAVLAVNGATVWAYAADKRAAVRGRRRVPENQLHLLSLLGGWPGAWLAQQALRHKTSKPAFRAAYWLTVAAHNAVLAAWLARGGRWQQLLPF